MKYITTNKNNKDFITLCTDLDISLNNIVHGDDTAQKYNLLNKLDDICGVIIAYDNEMPVGCASYKKLDNTTIEVKRVFVDKSHRKMGIARELMKRIEKLAKSNGYMKARLETGRNMLPAVSLYKSIEYKEIPNYGDYADMPKSICFEIQL